MRAWLKVIVWLAALIGAALLVLHQFFLTWRVPTDDPLLSASIEPTLSAGDLVVVVRNSSVARGHLLLCADPDTPGRFVVGRAIGRSGEHVELNNEVVSLDGHRTPSPRACDTPVVTVNNPSDGEDMDLSCSMEDYGDRSFSTLRANQHPEPPTNATVEAGLWFLLSDNRHIHLDSRDYGQVAPSACQHIVFRVVSAAGFGDAPHRLSIIW